MRLIWFIIIFAFFLELLDVGIPDSPLSNLSSEIIGDGGTSCCSPFFDWRIDSLYFSVFVVEFILHGLLYSFNIFSWSRLFVFSLALDSLKLGFPLVINFFLYLELIGACVNVISFKRKVHDQLINRVIGLIFSLEIVVHHSVWFSLWIRDNQSASHCEVQFSRGKSVGLGDFLNVSRYTWFSSSYYSLTTLISWAWMISGFFGPFFCLFWVVR